MINPVNSSLSGLEYKPAGSQNTASKRAEKKSNDYDSAFSVDISISGSIKKGIGLSADEIESIKDQADLSSSSLKDVVEKLIVKQQNNASTYTINIEILGTTGEVASSQADATAGISENGEWGVNAVSDRIVSFAKALSGGDTGKIEMLRDAIDKGFASAQKTLGGKLPDISSQTYDAVMSKLDDWANESDSVTAE